MPRETISGIHDCAKALSIKYGCSIATARRTVIDVLDVIEEEIMRLGGVQFVGRWTLKKHYKKERQGFNPASEKIMTIPGRYSLKLTVGKHFLEKLNPSERVFKPIPFKRVGMFKPRLNIHRSKTNKD